MKIWFFLEGGSERECIINLVRRFYPNCLIVDDLSEYVTLQSSDVVHHIYLDDCSNVSRIPHAINEEYYLVQRSNTDYLVVFCDIEREFHCARNRKIEIERILNQVVERHKIKYVFSRLIIESVYWSYPAQLTDVIEVIFSLRRGGRTLSQPVVLPTAASNPLSDLNKLMKTVGLKYRETEFAKEFFPRFASLNELQNNETLNRIKIFLESL